MWADTAIILAGLALAGASAGLCLRLISLLRGIRRRSPSATLLRTLLLALGSLVILFGMMGTVRLVQFSTGGVWMVVPLAISVSVVAAMAVLMKVTAFVVVIVLFIDGLSERWDAPFLGRSCAEPPLPEPDGADSTPSGLPVSGRRNRNHHG